MRINAWPQNHWRQICDELTVGIGWDLSKSEVRLIPSVQQALMDAVYGLRRLTPTKKKLFYFKDMDPNFLPAVTALAKEGLEVHPLDLSILQTPEALTEKLGRDTLFVLFSADDPLLGQRYATQKLEAYLLEQPSIAIRVSYQAHIYEGVPACARNSIHIMGTDLGYGLLGLGERARVGMSGSEWRSWSHINSQEVLSSLQKKSAAEQKIFNFESASPAGASAPWLNRARVWDRAVLAWSDLDGHALIHRLSQTLGFALLAPGDETRLETLSLTRWGGVRTFEGLNAWGLTPEQVRGSVIISADLIDDQLAQKLVSVRQSILEDQGLG